MFVRVSVCSSMDPRCILMQASLEGVKRLAAAQGWHRRPVRRRGNVPYLFSTSAGLRGEEPKDNQVSETIPAFLNACIHLATRMTPNSMI